MALTTINSGGVKDDSIVNADIKSDAAIALSKLASTPAVLTGSTNNTICTVTGANAIQGEANLTFDGTNLSLTGEFDLSGDIRISDTIKHTGDVDTKIRFPAADTFSVEAGAVEKLRIEGDYAGTVDVKGIPAHLRLYSQRDTDDWDATDPIGKLDYYVGSDTSNNLPYNAGFIHCLNETENANEPSGALVFGTSTANASGGAVERLRIDSSGDVGIGTSSPAHKLHVEDSVSNVIVAKQTTNNGGYNTFAGVDSFGNVKFYASHNGRVGAAGGIIFGSDTAAANVLDDYEEGTWTPSIEFGGGSTGVTYSSYRSGSYVKIGNIVHLKFGFALTSNGSSEGSARITGLPFNGTHSGYFHDAGASIMVNGGADSTGGHALVFLTETSKLAVRQGSKSDGNYDSTHTAFNDDTGFFGNIVYNTSA